MKNEKVVAVGFDWPRRITRRCGGFTMDLALESGLVVADAEEADLLLYIEGEAFAILSVNDVTYIQCALCKDPSSGYVLEYQDGSVDRHYEALDGPYELEDVLNTFISYLNKDSAWRSNFRWAKMKL
jgi:hypothetical protein